MKGDVSTISKLPALEDGKPKSDRTEGFRDKIQ
jgi:hypothetical protein